MSRYPEYTSLQSRITSFRASFPIKGITPTEFAQAGFYSIGFEDYTRCFDCGVGLRGWDNTDDPWKQHAKFSPKCKYLLSEKGQSFVLSQTNSTSLENSQKSDIPKTVPSNKNKSLNEKEIELHVKARMDTKAIQMILNYKHILGFDEESMKEALETELRIRNDDFSDTKDLIDQSIKIYKKKS